MESTDRTELARDRRQASAGLPEQADWESPDASCEVATILRSKRWEVRDGPFRGFDSPPGKF